MNTPLNHALKPCPFCGAEAEVSYNYPLGNPILEFGCGKCGATRPTEAAWNTRANTPESSAAQGAMGDDILRKAVANVISEWNIPADVRKILETAYWAQPSDATAQPSNSDHARILVKMHEARADFNQLVELLGFDAKRIRKEDGSVDWSLLEDGMKTRDELAAQPRVDLTDERAALKEEIKALNIKLAGETLRADQGWERYESANKAHMNCLNDRLANTAQGKP